ncbi:MAG TPA: tRNA (adenosine(37)-N6)-threonylcarbamoyltransferase complex dimerization subunit type 1 TsaB [Geobacteraceae bacterium]|nr:tRNA (adenosine(37)-N6)-threonylcarbamoyltransferase complex dimerization subunit type 1 TsaB [Geobacteraceae bacterium]
MKLFIIDTSTSVFSMAVADSGTLLAEEMGVAGPSTAARLAPAISGLFAAAGLTPADMDGFAVTVGPGAFTGLRVGIALVKGLAYATGKPVIPLSSLALLAMNARGSDMPVCPLFDARKGEVYGALYNFATGTKPTVADTAADPATFLRQLDGRVLFLGDGATRYADLIADIMGDRAEFAGPSLLHPRASAGIDLARSLFASGGAIPSAQLLPRYLRLSEAELNRR